jgi:hypothetical protein
VHNQHSDKICVQYYRIFLQYYSHILMIIYLFLLVFIKHLFCSSFYCDMSAVCFAEMLSFIYGIVVQRQGNSYSRVSFMFAIKRNLL